MYREFEEQRMGYQQMKEKNADMYEKMTSSFFNMATPSNLQTLNKSNWLSPSNWQTPNPSYLGTPNSQPPIPSQPGTSNWQNPMTSRRQDAGILDPHMESWIQILIRKRTENANWTLAKSGTVCLHPENNCFMILTDPHNIETLDGSVRPFPSWNVVTWVYMPINAGGVH
nr:hypothetical protein [Tanacetum cinerariifolium]